MFFATLMYYLERDNPCQADLCEELFDGENVANYYRSVPEAMWMTFSTRLLNMSPPRA